MDSSSGFSARLAKACWAVGREKRRSGCSNRTTATAAASCPTGRGSQSFAPRYAGVFYSSTADSALITWERQLQLVAQALDFWRDLIFDRRVHPGEFELHVLPLPGLNSAKGFELPPNMNRYFAREVEADVGSTEKSAFVQVKICRLMVLGFVQMPNAREWKGTRVKMRRGSIGGARTYCVPKNFGDYLIERAKHVASLQASISERQKQKIVAAMRSDPDRAAASDTFEATSQDVNMFGPAAFRRPDEY